MEDPFIDRNCSWGWDRSGGPSEIGEDVGENIGILSDAVNNNLEGSDRTK